jgi:hypothetical protein
MKKMKIFIVIIFFLFGSFGKQVFAQTNQPPQTLTPAQQQKDFKIFRGALEEIHAGLNWHISEKDLSRLFDETYNSLAETAATEDYYLKLRRVMASLRHGHGGVTLRREDGVNYRLAALAKSRKFLPLAIRILNGRVFVAVNCSSNAEVTTGTEITSINGESVRKILDRQLPLMFANGRNTSFKYANLENYYQFHYLYQLMNPKVERFRIEAILPGKRKKQTFLLEGENPQIISERFEKIKGRGISDYSGRLKYRILDEKNKIAYLQLGSFYKGLVPDYVDFLDKTFTEIKQAGVRHLIVDVRENEGGGDGYWQMAYTYTTGNRLEGGGGLPFVNGDKFSYLKYVENPSPDFAAFANDPYALIFKLPDGRFQLKPQFTEEDTRAFAAPPNAFTGKLYVLHDGMTFSAGTAYVETVLREFRRQNRFVKFIGTEPGDDFNSGVASGGSSADLRLPNSKISINIPLLAGGAEKPYAGAEKISIPDYKIVPTAEDLAKGADAELNFTIDLIRKNYLK